MPNIRNNLWQRSSTGKKTTFSQAEQRTQFITIFYFGGAMYLTKGYSDTQPIESSTSFSDLSRSVLITTPSMISKPISNKIRIKDLINISEFQYYTNSIEILL